MAVIVFKCPYCEEKLETSGENVGREGQCAKCDRIFEIPNPRQSEAPASAAPSRSGLFSAAPSEYEDTGLLTGAVGMGAALLLLVGAALLPWSKDGDVFHSFVSVEKFYLLTGSVACLVFLGLSALTRKSLVPAVLAAAGWGVCTLIWVGGLWKGLGSVAEAQEVKTSGGSGGFYLAVVAAVLLVLATIYVYFQCRDSKLLRRFGVYVLSLLVVGGCASIILLTQHVRPGLHRAAVRYKKFTAQVEEQQRREREQERREREEAEESAPLEFELLQGEQEGEGEEDEAREGGEGQ